MELETEMKTTIERNMPSKPEPTEPRPIKAADVEIGARYRIKHSSGFITVKVLCFKSSSIRSRDYGARIIGQRKQYVCLNERSGREIVVKSAAKFRARVED
jgi:hypothetical protein